MRLVKIDEVTDLELISLQNDFRISKELIHGCNGLVKANKLRLWKKNIRKLENDPSKDKVKTIQFFMRNESNQLVGVIDFRCKLLPFQELNGGHISYTVRKEERGKGYAKKALKEVLKIVKEKSKLKEVLLTCETANIASKKVIKSCGGKLEKTIFINNNYIEHYRIKLK